MSSSDNAGDPKLNARFAALFKVFAASPSSTASRGEAAFIVTCLDAPRGARLVCCDRSVVAFGWGLTAQGCAVSPLSAALGAEPFDGALCALDELGCPPQTTRLAWLAQRLAGEGRLVLDAGHGGPAAAAIAWAARTEITGMTPIGEARSPQDRRLYVWSRSAP